jgi:hypothetical protein
MCVKVSRWLTGTAARLATPKTNRFLFRFLGNAA